MILLDTDHLSVLQSKPSDRRNRLVARMAVERAEVFAAPIVAIEEQLRGWLASLAKERQIRRQIVPYRELGKLFDFYTAFQIIPFDEAAAGQFESFGGIRVGIADRKIAAISLAQRALLLTANRRDFERVPGLRFENWMD